MKKPHDSLPTSWTGLPSASFREYRTWKNTERPGICGTYVSSVLLHYVFKEYYGTHVDEKTLIHGLRRPIEYALPYRGTFPWDVKRGLDIALKKEIGRAHV